MKFTAFKGFKKLGLSALLEEVANYLGNELRKWAQDLQVGLTRMTFLDNFQSFEVTVTILPGVELQVRNELLDAIPTQRLLVAGGAGSQNIVDGAATWTLDFVYLKNTGGTTATATFVFLK